MSKVALKRWIRQKRKRSNSSGKKNKILCLLSKLSEVSGRGEEYHRQLLTYEKSVDGSFLRPVGRNKPNNTTKSTGCHLTVRKSRQNCTFFGQLSGRHESVYRQHKTKVKLVQIWKLFQQRLPFSICDETQLQLGRLLHQPFRTKIARNRMGYKGHIQCYFGNQFSPNTHKSSWSIQAEISQKNQMVNELMFTPSMEKKSW